MPVVSVSMPPALLERLDAFTEEHAYSGRSEALREGVRTLLTEFEDRRLEGRPLAGIVAVRYAFGNHAVERALTDVRHEYDALVVSADHSHVGPTAERPSESNDAVRSSGEPPRRYCLDLFVLEGTLAECSQFVGSCRSIDDVETVEYTLLPLDEERSIPN
ncbi:CopG family ribbon-helix-helix protein [Halopiger goleimassiliensis]|uniref:CopG family ribbon-helix-helix protein n=1 Tax=Halopiger goleimassiliensis TaxID=1293048 RepID=UPI0006776D55|nr:CopG family ribbon-helix-helix protein [Halopiger goleimassiliensis]